MNITELLIDYIFEKLNNGIDKKVYIKSQECLIDYIGVTFAGLKENEKNIYDMCKRNDGRGDICICGASVKTDRMTASFVNGFNAHTLELDDGSRFGMIHLGAAIISPLLILIQEEDISYKDFLKGIIMGYEVAVKVSMAMQPEHKRRGFHTSGTCGTLGAAVAIAVARDYNREQLKSSISAAATSAAGLLEIQEDNSMLKPYNLGHAAMSGLMAAETGKMAIPGPDDILGGARGMLKLLGSEINQHFLQRTDNFEIERIYVKPYAACRHCHSAIEAVLKLRNNNINADEIRKINIFTYKLAIKGHEHKEIKGKNSAKLSIPYSVAAAFILGKSDVEVFEEKVINNKEIKELLKKVNVFEDEEYTKESSKKRIAGVQIILKSGKKFCERVDFAKGDPENPMSHEEIIGKYYQLIEWAGMKEHGEAVLKRIENEGEKLK